MKSSKEPVSKRNVMIIIGIVCFHVVFTDHGHSCNVSNDRIGELTATNISALSVMSAPQVREGKYRRLIPNGTGFAGIDCREVPQAVCYEANPQEGNKTLYIIDPCGENISILVNNNPDRIETAEYYVDPETGENCITYWFDPPLEPIE